MTAGECLPWGVGPGGTSDPSCAGTATPGVFFPGLQCAWLGPPPGDPYPEHVNVMSTPMVATLDDPTTPSIVFTSYNGSGSCIGGDLRFYSVIRVIDGRTCEQRATIAARSVLSVAPLAIADLSGDATPEIVAANTEGGLVAFTHGSTGWEVLWQTQTNVAAGKCDLAGPSIHDLDDDGVPEVIFWGAVYNGKTGAVIDESLTERSDLILDSNGAGYIPVVADVDGDGVPELVTGANLYSWDRQNRKWAVKHTLPGVNSLVAVGDFGTFPAIGQDDRSRLDGIAEIAVAYQGIVRVFNTAGREVFTASFRDPKDIFPTFSEGGPLTIADFDGDGRVEIGSAGLTSYHVFDPDCRKTASGAPPDPATCASLSTDGVLWTSPTQKQVGRLGSSSAFDFDGDGRPEIVYGDQCFTRIYDGATGKVMASHQRTSCVGYENPVIADSDRDSRAELITTSNTACHVACPPVDPVFDGVACVDDADCSGATRCDREHRGDAIGRCRCTQDADCGDGYACRDPIAGPSPAGKVCRASHAAAPSTGVQVLADTADRWIGARPIWNQHAYSVTNIDPYGWVPRTSQWLRNWTQPGLNNFRVNTPGNPAAPRGEPDLTVKQAKILCDATGPTVSAEVCNRGNQVVSAGVPVAVYATTTPSQLRCQAQTAAAMPPGACTTVSCIWQGPGGDGAVVVDDRGNGSGAVRECREDNNLLGIHVSCP